MKTTSLTTLAVLACSLAALAAPNDMDPAARQLQIYPKNLARHHVGSNLFIFNATNQTFTPTEAAAAWLDDDVTTGWPVMAGKQHYLLALAEPQLLTNFAVSTRPAAGTVTLYAGDEATVPGSKSWSVVARDIPLDSINHKKLAKPFSRFAKYLLIETDIADPGPVFSLYVYGDRPAVAYQLRKRDTAVDTKSIFGPYLNNQTSLSVSALYSRARVTYATAPDGFLAWQKAIDDNPESSLALSASTNNSGAVVKFDSKRSITRVALLTDGNSKGRLDFFVVPQLPGETAAPGSEVVQVSNPASAPAARPMLSQAASLNGLTPTVSVVLDGMNPRSSIDFPATEGSALLVRWTPDNGTDTVAIRELNTFSDLSLGAYELAMTPEAVAELGADPSKDGKSFKEFKGGKELAPVAAPPSGPYLPGALGFPPNITGRSRPVSNPRPLSQ